MPSSTSLGLSALTSRNTRQDSTRVSYESEFHLKFIKDDLETEETEQRLREEDFGDTWTGAFRSYFWDLLEYPETSKSAQAIAFTSMFFVFSSTLTFVVESNLEHDLEILAENVEFLNSSHISESETKQILKATQILDQLAITFFTLEYCLRLALCPNKRKFLLDKMNLIDLIAIIPFYISLLLAGLEDMEIIGKAGKLIRLIRLMRILRIFKMIRHFVGLQSLVYTLHQAYKDLGLILIIVSVTILMFSSLMFAFEREGVSVFPIGRQFNVILDAVQHL